MVDGTDTLKGLIEELRQMIKTETVVGQPIVAGNTTVIPVSKVSFGFAGGGGDRPRSDKGAGKEASGASGMGGGASIEPIAFIVISDGKAQLLSIGEKGGLSLGKVIDLIPDLIDQVKGFKTRKSKDEKSDEV